MTQWQGQSYWWGRTFWSLFTRGRFQILIPNLTFPFDPEIRRYGLKSIDIKVATDIPLAPFFQRHTEATVMLPVHEVTWEVTTLFPPSLPAPGIAERPPFSHALSPPPAPVVSPPALAGSPLLGLADRFRGTAKVQPSIRYRSDKAWRVVLLNLKLNILTLDVFGLEAPLDQLVQRLVARIFEVHEKDLVRDIQAEYSELNGVGCCGWLRLPWHRPPAVREPEGHEKAEFSPMALPPSRPFPAREARRQDAPHRAHGMHKNLALEP